MAAKTKINTQRKSYSGTIFYGGRVQSDEYVPELQDVKTRIEKYDEMMRSNATVQEAVTLFTAPILTATWTTTPASLNKKDVEVKDFVDAVIMKNWSTFLDEALDMLPFGFAPFEIVYEDIMFNGQKKLGVSYKYIHPKTIYQFFLDVEEPYIVQRTDNGKTADIPLKDMLIFTFKKRGDDYTGNSVLRAAYPHWYRVQQYYKFASIAGERTAVGIPFGKYPKGVSEAQREELESVLANIRANEQAYITYPNDWEVGVMQMQSDKAFDFIPHINHHNIEIARAALVSFMHLGSGTNGSRAASYDQSTVYENAMEAVAKKIAEVMNTVCIPQLVQYNFADVKEYPTLTYSGLKRDDIATFADVMNKLLSAGAITSTPNTEQWVRGKLNAPEREDIMDQQRKIEVKKEDEGQGMEAGERKHVAIERQENETLDDCVERAIPILIDEGMEQSQAVAVAYSMCKVPKKKAEEQSKKIEASDDAEKNGSFFRRFTAAEEKVSFENLERKIDRDEEKLKEGLTGLTEQQIEEIIGGLLIALRSPAPLESLQTLRVSLVEEYGMKILENIRQTFEYAKMTTADEMEVILGENSVPVPKTTQEEMQKMQFKAAQVAKENSDKLQNNIINRASELYIAGRSPEDVAYIVRTDVEEKQNKIIEATAAALVIQAINQGRTFTQQTFASKIEGYQYSAILDKRTCNFCRALDGKVIRKDDPAYKRLMPPQHFSCRCVWVEVLIEEQNKPEVTGIPAEINQDMGLSTFKNIDKKTLNDIQ